MASSSENLSTSLSTKPGLKKIPPYWYPYRTNAKARWFDREILEVVSTEFRDRSVEYYRYALESGVTTINGKVAKPGTLIRNGDILENIVHRHEPPVTSTPVQILHHDKDRKFIVINKPGSIPVHAAGRYFKNSLVEILKDDFGFENVHTVNRLDRLTSGLMIIALSTDCARNLTAEFTAGTVRKEYIARVQGEFPEGEITCEQPLLTIDRQMGLNVVHPDGKHAKTVFKRLHYDVGTDSTVVHCRPFTGRSHQIRVHLQYLGYPIANDSVYSSEKIWGKKMGKGGIDLIPNDERSAPVPPPEYQNSTAEGRHRLTTEQRAKKALMRLGNPAWRTKDESTELTADHNGKPTELLPRETGHDIGMGSPVPLSLEAVGIITRLRNQKDEDEDWGRWRDVIFRAKGALKPKDLLLPTESVRQKRGKPNPAVQETSYGTPTVSTDTQDCSLLVSDEKTLGDMDAAAHSPEGQTTITDVNIVTEGLAEVAITSNTLETKTWNSDTKTEDTLYCPECYLPLHPDPNPEKLYIFLHAIRYTTSLGSFETSMPYWAAPDFSWER